jgi:hypothetical protein
LCGPGVSERRVAWTSGIAIGLAIALILLGLFGWSNAAYMYATLGSIFEGFGLEPRRHYVFRDLDWLISGYQAITVAGVVVLLLGVLFERQPGLWGVF